MKLTIGYEKPHNAWSICHVFERFHKSLDIDIEFIEYNYLPKKHGPCDIYSCHNMRIMNENGKYIVVSYWDRAIEMTWEGTGWKHENCVAFITSAGVTGVNYIPFSYLPYCTFFSENYMYAKQMSDKKNNELSFRGLLYGQRQELANLNKIQIINEKIQPYEKYYEDLTNTKICLSLNGAGEICNRDIEILAARSVLFRPLLTSRFHNELKPNFHYHPFEYNQDPKIQMDIIINEYNKIKDNEEYLTFISENGYKWFIENGTIDANVNILKNIIDLSILLHEPEIQPEIQPEIHPELQHEIQSEIQPEIQPEMQPEIHHELQPEIYPEIQIELQPEIQPEMQPEIQPELQHEIQPEIQPELQHEIQPEIQPELQHEIQPEMQPEIQHQMQHQMQPERKSTVQKHKNKSNYMKMYIY